jgi:AraC-like DNA-binding protein
MCALIRVEDEPPAARLDYLRHVAGDTIAPVELHVETDRALRAQILTGEVGALRLTRIMNAPRVTVSRTAALIRRSDPELFKISFAMRGHEVIGQGDREAALAPGDLTLVDQSHPFRVATRDGHEFLAVQFSPAAVPLPRDALERLTAVPISGRDGLGASISSLARHIAPRLEEQGPTDGVRLAAALMDLLIVMLAGRLDRVTTVAPATRRRALLATLQAFIDSHLADPELSPSTIAAAHHISLRYLHRLFEGQGTTVGERIKNRRLESCRQDLLDPSLAALPVNAIASRWGFIDAARFSRAFRDAYGQPPGEFRRHLATPLP